MQLKYLISGLKIIKKIIVNYFNHNFNNLFIFIMSDNKKNKKCDNIKINKEIKAVELKNESIRLIDLENKVTNLMNLEDNIINLEDKNKEGKINIIF